jgi:DNA-nicking Smr family endonuclease
VKARLDRLRSLEELGAVLKGRAQAAARAAAIEREHQRLQIAEQRRLEHEQQAFARAVGPVTPVAHGNRAQIHRQRPAPWPAQRMKDEQAALRSALSDEVDLESLLLTDDGLSYRRPEIALDVLARLRKGHWAIQRQIDLHGLRRDEAREALAIFLRQTRQQGHRCLRVVHGKGLGSPGREPVLKGKVQRWLAQCDEVIAFAQASGPQGGAGALIVLLAP